MAVLSDADRVAVWAEWMRLISADHELCGITKADLRAAVNALDDWINANAAAINLAIPQPARSSLTSAQKARLLTLIVTRRYLSGA